MRQEILGDLGHIPIIPVYQEEFGLTQDIAGAEKSYFSVMLMRT